MVSLATPLISIIKQMRMAIAVPLSGVEFTSISGLSRWRDPDNGEKPDNSEPSLTVGRSSSVLLGRYQGADVCGTVVKHHARISFAVAQYAHRFTIRQNQVG